ncbi:hypothetical protein HBI88_196190 [Parastagonospora nodorum]|nr:hypothetical protein HBI75_143910 [Parastagonospora nodorum]KAH5188892.1 hypothetical protein HBH68_159300 [Parastagonospora nodorum]KAH5250125.1 hypothetical protein HBI72_157040 [Parastagonospora nodorum]KAH5447715.1 hypothetical protein HBI30_177440 [Parastagonospora nodorum]KAH5536517.1 hypothetical protein HBI27_159780 [Parastagonospora nodorum]
MDDEDTVRNVVEEERSRQSGLAPVIDGLAKTNEVLEMILKICLGDIRGCEHHQSIERESELDELTAIDTWVENLLKERSTLATLTDWKLRVIQSKAQLLGDACLSIGKALLMLRKAHARGLQIPKHASPEDCSAAVENLRYSVRHQALKAIKDHLSRLHMMLSKRGKPISNGASAESNHRS